MFSENSYFELEEGHIEGAQFNLYRMAIGDDLIDPDLQLKLHLESLFEPDHPKLLSRENDDLGSNVGVNSQLPLCEE